MLFVPSRSTARTYPSAVERRHAQNAGKTVKQVQMHGYRQRTASVRFSVEATVNLWIGTIIGVSEWIPF